MFFTYCVLRLTSSEMALIVYRMSCVLDSSDKIKSVLAANIHVSEVAQGPLYMDSIFHSFLKFSKSLDQLSWRRIPGQDSLAAFLLLATLSRKSRKRSECHDIRRPT